MLRQICSMVRNSGFVRVSLQSCRIDSLSYLWSTQWINGTVLVRVSDRWVVNYCSTYRSVFFCVTHCCSIWPISARLSHRSSRFWPITDLSRPITSLFQLKIFIFRFLIFPQFVLSSCSSIFATQLFDACFLNFDFFPREKLSLLKEEREKRWVNDFGVSLWVRRRFGRGRPRSFRPRPVHSFRNALAQWKVQKICRKEKISKKYFS